MNIFEESEGRLHSRDILSTLLLFLHLIAYRSSPLRFILSVRLSAIIGMTNGSRILQLRANQCFCMQLPFYAYVQLPKMLISWYFIVIVQIHYKITQTSSLRHKKVNVSNDKEMAQSERKKGRKIKMTIRYKHKKNKL